jgi:hypothetical protein
MLEAHMAEKFEREIDEILRRFDKLPSQSPGQRFRRRLAQRVVALQRALAVRVAHLSVSQVMVAGIVLVLFGFFFRAGMPGIWSYVVVLGLILFFTAFGLSFLGFGAGRSPSSGRIYWRGRPTDWYYEGNPSLVNRLRDWWRRRRGQR